MTDEDDDNSVRSMDGFLWKFKDISASSRFQAIIINPFKASFTALSFWRPGWDWLQHEIIIIIILEATRKLHNFGLEIILFNRVKAPPTKRN